MVSVVGSIMDAIPPVEVLVVQPSAIGLKPWVASAKKSGIGAPSLPQAFGLVADYLR
jgi:hypothetical protein